MVIDMVIHAHQAFPGLFFCLPVAQLAVNAHQGLALARKGIGPEHTVDEVADQVRCQGSRQRSGLVTGEQRQCAAQRGFIGANRTGQGRDGIPESDRAQSEQGPDQAWPAGRMPVTGAGIRRWRWPS